ncbi:MAG: nitrous oxide reductase accessory protein NosL [Deltaproteobacteria bacterium]|nr:nitrous oxide reductase accessory protein NosL [Deltaproteobacteria bacterium]TLN03473.1 MAG: nitrous oxide reductase accessory protein NosL [bacterium]
MVLLLFATLAMTIFLFSAAVFAAGPKALKPAAKDKCPVCGMFVAKYPDFVAQIQFRDGSVAFFDGVKDLLKYYRNLSRYAPGKKAADISALYVTDYYSLRYLDGFKACYVSGSDVFGPMGKELVPFGKKSDAQEFLRDHKGRAIFSFREINDAVMKSLE